jgi:predicted DNA-binding transcriptional regulator AlpA
MRAKGRAAASETVRVDLRPWRGLRRPDAAHYIGVSPSKFDELVRDERMPQPFRIDGCIIWDIRALESAFDALAYDEPTENEWDRVL